MQRYWRLLIIPLASILLLATIGCGRDWTPAKIQQSKAIGNKILDAIDQYHADNGSFPERLEDLVPKYLKEVKPPTAGTREWQYGRSDGTGWFETGEPDCSLSFSRGRHHYPNCQIKWLHRELGWIDDR